MFNVFNWISNFFDFFGGKIQTLIGIFILFCLYIFFHFLILWKKTEFKITIRRLLKTIGTIFIIYLIYSLALVLKKDFFVSIGGNSAEIDVLLFPILCGFLVFLFLLIFNKVQFFTSSKFVILLGIPICIFGVMISFVVFYVVPLNYTQQGRHVPLDLIVIILFFLIFLSFFIGIKNLVKKNKEEK